MAYVWQRSLADDLRAAGLTVIEHDGWKNRGRPASTGHFDPNGASTAHHTGVTSSKTNPAPGLQTLIHGRADLPGPLSQLATDYLGRVHVIAAGRANHAGRVGRRGVRLMPFGADGNALAVGNEVITDGTQKMPAEQYDAVVTVHAVLALRAQRRHKSVHRHEDISATGKWDLGGITTPALRADVRKEIRHLEAPSAAPLKRTQDDALLDALVVARRAAHAAAVADRDARVALDKAIAAARTAGRTKMAGHLTTWRSWFEKRRVAALKRRDRIQKRVTFVRGKIG